MELIYLIIFMCSISGVFCAKGECFVGFLLGGITILILVIIIICLSVSLYMARNNKTVLGFNITKRPVYVRQESGLGGTLRQVTSSINNIAPHYRDDGSTNTINGDMVEIINEPETPTQIEETKPTCVIKKPKAPAFPTIQKAQMDDIIKTVLSRKQKSDSATFRELDILTKPISLKPTDDEFAVRRNSFSLNQLDALANANDEDGESLYENRQTINNMKHKYMTTVKQKTKKPMPNTPQPGNLKQSISFDSLQSKNRVQGDQDEQEVYDTLPKPLKCTTDAEGDIENLPVYDMPPRRQQLSESKNVIMDKDSDYLLPITQRIPGDQEDTYYVNANLRKKDKHKA